jgi:hypothetical protein
MSGTQKPKIAEPPKNGLWRVGRSPDPLRFSDPLDPGLLENRTTGSSHLNGHDI